jgi:subtilisin
MTHMRRVRSMVCVLVAVTLVITSFGAAPVASEADGRFIVIYVDGTNLNLQASLLTALGVEVTQVLSLINALAIKIPLGLVGYVLQQLQLNLLVAGVYDDIEGAAAEVTPTTLDDISNNPSEEGWAWGIIRIGGPNVQQNGSNGAGVVVAVLDTGIDCAHSELQDNIVSYAGFSAFKTNPCSDPNGHGTHIAGIIAAAADQHGLIGAAPEATLVPVQVLDQNAHTFCSQVVAGLQFVYSKGIKVVNMSFGFHADCVPLKKAVKRTYDRGTIMVASAGNCGSSGFGDEGGGDGGGDPPATCDPSQFSVAYPAKYAEVIAVAATTLDDQGYDQMAYYSAIGAAIAVSAPGGDKAHAPIVSTAPGGRYALKSGTSMAAGHVSAGVMLALQRKQKLSSMDVRNLLRSTATYIPGSAEQKGAGLINLEGMLQAIR